MLDTSGIVRGLATGGRTSIHQNHRLLPTPESSAMNSITQDLHDTLADQLNRIELHYEPIEQIRFANASTRRYLNRKATSPEYGDVSYEPLRAEGWVYVRSQSRQACHINVSPRLRWVPTAKRKRAGDERQPVQS